MDLKSKIKNKELSIGSWISIPHSSVVEIMASAGFEWLVVDIEHTATSLETAMQMISTIQSCGCKALVRVSKNEEVVIKRVMDSGADGIIVPMINSRDDLKQAISYMHYPPVGKRGVGLYRAQGYGTKFEEYKKWLSTESILIAQIEHIDGVNNLSDILEEELLDGVLVGPYDLSASMGMPGNFTDPKFLGAMEKIENISLESNKVLGAHVIPSTSESIEEKVARGYSFLAFSLDFFFLGDRAREEMEKIQSKFSTRK